MNDCLARAHFGIKFVDLENEERRERCSRSDRIVTMDVYKRMIAHVVGTGPII